MREPRLQRLMRTLALACAFLVPAMILGFFLWRFLAWEQQLRLIADVKERILAENELFKTLIQIGGGGLLLAGFYFTWKTIHVAQEGQITDRFNKAIDHLGQTNMSVRLGGIYALARIAADSEKDAPTVTQVLTAYIREATATSTLNTPAPDVKSILTILGMDRWAKEVPKNLSGCKLRGLVLEDANLQDWNLTDADLSEANLQRSNLDGSTLLGADLGNAYLRHCSLMGANLTAANLEGATLRDAQVRGAQLFGARLTNTSMLGTNFTGAAGAVRQQFESAILDDSTTLPEFRVDLP